MSSANTAFLIACKINHRSENIGQSYSSKSLIFKKSLIGWNLYCVASKLEFMGGKGWTVPSTASCELGVFEL